MATRRTVQADPVLKSNGKWACVFQNFGSHRGEEYLASEVETAGVWFDGRAARVAGDRALQTLAETGKYPNMCEIW